MSIYHKIGTFGSKFIKPHILFKMGFNLAPMYRRTTGKVTYVSEDLLMVSVKIPLSYKNKNYVNTIFGGSMFSAVDPFPMVQLINLIGDEYVVWDKSAEINFKRPARENLYADFTYTQSELQEIEKRVAEEHEIDIVKTTLLTNKDRTKVFCEVHKTIYIASKSYFKKKKLIASQKPNKA